ALADQRLDERDHRAFAEIIGGGLERETHDAHASLPGPEDRPHGAANLALVRWKDRGEEREREVGLPAGVEQRPKVLWQTRPPECKAGTQVRLGDVELPIHQEDT